MDWKHDTKFKHPTEAVPVPLGVSGGIGGTDPASWWYVHHPDGFLIECMTQERACQIAYEINAGRSSMVASAARVGDLPSDRKTLEPPP